MILHQLFNGQHSKPYNKIGKHLHLTNSRTTSSEATLPIFPKIALVARKNIVTFLLIFFYLYFIFFEKDVDVDVERSRLRHNCHRPVFNIQHTITNKY